MTRKRGEPSGNRSTVVGEPSPPARRWRILTALFCAIGGLTPLAQSLELLRTPSPAAAALLVQLAAAALWYLTSEQVARRWSLADSEARALAGLGALTLAVTASSSAALLGVLRPPSPYGAAASWAVVALAWLPTHAVTAGLLSLVGSWTDGRRQRAREAALRAAAVEAELAALRARLEPHFLLNTLNTIAGLARSGDGERAGAVTADLGDLLRFALAESKDAVPFDAEREIVERYVAIEQARLGDRLVVEWALDPAARTAALPALLWQPLVENAVRHGIARRATPGRLLLTARVEKSRLHLLVDADGPDRSRGPHDSARDLVELDMPADEGTFGGLGLGLRTTERRLALLYGKSASLARRSRPGGTCVELTLPITAPTEASGAELHYDSSVR
ncbi:MAG: histidine kinase [Gemmatimonadota bacterium]